MPGKEQERFEDYGELEAFIEKLQAGHIAHSSKQVTSDQARIYAMVMLFRTLAPQVLEPRAAFVIALRSRLRQELGALTTTPASSSVSEPFQKMHLPISRRSLITGSVAVAASLVAGAGIEHTFQQTHICFCQ